MRSCIPSSARIFTIHSGVRGREQASKDAPPHEVAHLLLGPGLDHLPGVALAVPVPEAEIPLHVAVPIPAKKNPIFSAKTQQVLHNTAVQGSQRQNAKLVVTTTRGTKRRSLSESAQKQGKVPGRQLRSYEKA